MSERTRYPSDLTDLQWCNVEHLFPPERRAAPRGTTGGKKVSGRKRHLFVDTLGLIWALVVLPAGVHDRDGAKTLLGRLPALPRLAVIWADGAYQAVVDWVRETFGWAVTTVLRPVGAKGYVHLPKRWIVEQ